MSAISRPPADVLKYNIFKIAVLILLALAVGLTQWRADQVESSLSPIIPTPAPTSSPTAIVLATPSLFLDASASLIVYTPLTLRGRGTPDHIISVRQNDSEQGKAVVDPDGNWSFEVNLVEVGQFTWTAVATDGEGRVSAASSPLIIEVKPRSTPTLKVPDIADDFSGGDVLLSGSADPNSIVSILVDERIYDVVTADADGAWSYTLPLTTSGQHQIAAQLIDPAVDEILTSERIEITVP